MQEESIFEQLQRILSNLYRIRSLSFLKKEVEYKKLKHFHNTYRVQFRQRKKDYQELYLYLLHNILIYTTRISIILMLIQVIYHNFFFQKKYRKLEIQYLDFPSQPLNLYLILLPIFVTPYKNLKNSIFFCIVNTLLSIAGFIYINYDPRNKYQITRYLLLGAVIKKYFDFIVGEGSRIYGIKIVKYSGIILFFDFCKEMYQIRIKKQYKTISLRVLNTQQGYSIQKSARIILEDEVQKCNLVKSYYYQCAKKVLLNPKIPEIMYSYRQYDGKGKMEMYRPSQIEKNCLKISIFQKYLKYRREILEEVHEYNQL